MLHKPTHLRIARKTFIVNIFVQINHPNIYAPLNIQTLPQNLRKLSHTEFSWSVGCIGSRLPALHHPKPLSIFWLFIKAYLFIGNCKIAALCAKYCM